MGYYLEQQRLEQRKNTGDEWFKGSVTDWTLGMNDICGRLSVFYFSNCKVQFIKKGNTGGDMELEAS